MKHPIWMLGTDLRSSERAAGTLNCYAILPALIDRIIILRHYIVFSPLICNTAPTYVNLHNEV